MINGVIIDGMCFNRYPKVPEIGDVISIGGAETKIKSVVIDCHTGEIKCETEHQASQRHASKAANIGNTSAPVMVDDDGKTNAKASKPRNRRKGTRN